MKKMVLVGALMALAMLVVLFSWVEGGETAEDTQKPNIVFVSTNDQDTASLEQMPYVGGEFREQSKTFTNHTFAYPLCCPSRVTWLRGQFPHNHTVWTNTAELNGGYRRFEALGYDRVNLATRLHGNGYRTGMFGYYVNQTPYDGEEPGWDKFVGPNKTYTGENAGVADRAAGDRVISNNAVRFARENAGGAEPLFQWVSYYAPHHPFDYEPRFENRCQNIGLPPSPALDENTAEELADKPAFVRDKAAANAGYTDAVIAQDWKDRCRGLLTVDEGLKALVDEYRAKGELAETYFVFGTDNGYLLGEHGQMAKHLPYVESTRFPLIVKGPGVAPGTTDDRMVSNVDIYPTFMDIANISNPSYVDGTSMLPAWRGNPAAPVRGSALVEGRRLFGAPNYEGLIDQDWTYTEWATGEKEYYDLTTDPYQMENSYAGLTERRKVELSTRLDALKDCAGATCRAAGNAPRTGAAPARKGA